ncbi:hypothetical protein RJ640_007389 [Escallonia rubra]|uniref:Uncharacterized protein n=1 Tax=Escallonia rubra TaxID=112253 RepID=A0AA88RG88_9ASTE|nr:hypothetical protein RJ640_007389 [Escallonia rubra]
MIKFEEYTKDLQHTMNKYLKVMSNMIGKLRDVGHALTDEQQVRVFIRSLPASWANMKQILTHSENISNFFDISQHVILEAKTRDADKTLTYVAQEGSRNANGKRRRQSATKHVARDREGFVDYHWIQWEANIFSWETIAMRSIGDASKNLDLYELKEVEDTLPSPSEGGELVSHPIFAEDSISDPQPSWSIPDSGSTPPPPSGQQDSQLRKGARGRVPRRRFEIDEEIFMCTPTDEDEPTSVEEGANRDERRSTSGGAISWYSKKQSCNALSTIELEYVACSAAVQEVVWLRSFIQALGVTAHVDEVLAIHCDNTVALDFVKDPRYHGKAKHIGLRYHFIRTLVAE